MRKDRGMRLVACAAVLAAAFAALPQPALSQGGKYNYCSGYAENYARRNSGGQVVGNALAGAIGGAIIGGILGGSKALGQGRP